MEDKNSNTFSDNNKSTSFTKSRRKKIPHPKFNNLKYYPITTNTSYQGYPKIYLAAEDNQNHELANDIKNNKSMTSQKNIELLIQKNNCHDINYSNIKQEFISTTKNLYNNDNYKSGNKLIHSYSVDNYINITNKSLNLLGANLKQLENSKIMDNKFINGIKDKKRKDNLLNALKVYSKYKTFGKINDVDKVNNESDKNGSNLKRIEKIYCNHRKTYNVILEDENENYENDTLRFRGGKNYNEKNYANDIITKDKNALKNNKYEEICYKKQKINKPKIKINNNISKKIVKSFTDKNITSKEENSQTNDKSGKNSKVHQINDKEIKKCIKNSIQNETKKIYRENDMNQKNNFNININNNINNNINFNNILNINPNNNNKVKKPEQILIRKIMTEEKYIIDENGQEKILEVDQSIIADNTIHYNNKNNKILFIKDNHKKNNPKIMIINNNKEKHLIKRYYRNNNLTPGNNSFIKNKTTYNSEIKDNLNTKISRVNINNPEIFNNIKNHSIVYSKYQNRNNNKNNNKILYVNPTSPNQIIPYFEISLINNNINNHFYREIKKVNEKKNKKESKTIYHDYANTGRKEIFDNRLKNLESLPDNKNKLNKKVINKSHTKNYIQIPKNISNERKKIKFNVRFRNEHYAINNIPNYSNISKSYIKINEYRKRKEN